jgi:hypothetical protein
VGRDVLPLVAGGSLGRNAASVPVERHAHAELVLAGSRSADWAGRADRFDEPGRTRSGDHRRRGEPRLGRAHRERPRGRWPVGDRSRVAGA